MIENFSSYIPEDRLKELISYLFKLLNDYKEIYIVNKALECLNLLVRKTKYTAIIRDFINEYYNIYINLNKYDFCKNEIYSLIENIIKLFHSNKNQHKETFLDLLINSNYKIKFQKINKTNIFNEKKDDWYILQQLFSKFNLKSEKSKTHIFEWFFLQLDNYIIDNQQQIDMNSTANLDETEIIKTTQTQNVLNNMRLNTKSQSITNNVSLFKTSSGSGNMNDSSLYKQLKFDYKFLYKTFICVNLISKNKFNWSINNIDEKICIALEEKYDGFNLMKTLFNNYIDSKIKNTKIDYYKLYENFETISDNDDAKLSKSNFCNVDNIEIDEMFFKKVEMKLIEHNRFLYSYLLNIYELNFINYMISEFFFQLNFIANVEFSTKTINLNHLKQDLGGLFVTLHSLLDKCLKNDKYQNNNFLINTINLIVNKLYFNLYVLLEVNNEDVNQRIVELFFSIIQNTTILDVCFKTVFESNNNGNNQNDAKENDLNSTENVLANENPAIIKDFNILSNFETIFQQRPDFKIRLRLFSFLSFLSCIKYNYFNSYDLIERISKECKLFGKTGSRIVPELDALFGISITIIFLINCLKCNHKSFDTEISSTGMLSYCIKQIKALIKTKTNNDVYFFEIILKLLLSYSNYAIKIFQFHEFNEPSEVNEEAKRDLKSSLDFLIVLTSEIYNLSNLNVLNTDSFSEQKIFDSIENNRLLVALMSKSIYLISLIDSNTCENNELFNLKYLHLLCDKSYQIRKTVIDSIEFLFKNNENDFFKEIYGK